MKIRVFMGILRDAAVNSLGDRVPRLGAALAFYLTFSLAPLLLVTVIVASVAYGRQAAEGRLLSEIRPLVGDDLEVTVQNLLSIAQRPRSGWIATWVAGVTVLLGAIGFFSELQDALDGILHGPSDSNVSGIWRTIRTRLLSFGLVLGCGVLLLVSVAITTIVSNITGSLEGPLASVLAQSSLIHAVSLTASFAFVAVLFTMIYRFLPYTKMPWRSIWFGAIVGSVFFAIGKSILGFYLAQVATTSVYGTAASIVALMLWNYYSVQIFLYGAELTKAHARKASHSNAS